ncbi:MAG: aldo/keto reductase, partial [Lachnospiraceae bacterium]|nr:aldo/keto reductase [Lachnospiraceae bacterium]
MDKLTLSNGIAIPCMGFGCYNAFDDVITSAVRMALEAGYRYIDSAAFYKNEPAVGEGLSSYSGAREDLFVLSKAWPSAFEDMEAAFGCTAKDLRLEYLDAYIIHWPGTNDKRRLSAYEQLLRLTEKGYVRAPGVSNFNIAQLQLIRDEFGVYPAVHEIECHPS